MVTRLATAVTNLWDRLVSAGGRTIVYSRGATSLTLTAIKGSVLLHLSDGMGGTRILRTQDDYIVRAGDLAGLDPPEPALADCIQDQAELRNYAPLPPGPGEAHWRYTDSTRVLMRIHTR